MSLNVQLAGAKDVMGDMFVGTLTRVMQTQRAISSIMQEFAGALKQWRQQLQHEILMLRVMCWQRRSYRMAPS